MTFSQSTLNHLRYYVYGLVDPTTERIFYVGKADGNRRPFDHLKSDKDETEKQASIARLRALGKEPRIDILRYGLENREQALEVEAAIIDSIGLENLTNVVRGHGVARGRLTANEVERLHGAEPVAVEKLIDPYALFFIQQTYSPTKSEIELYDCTRQFWHGVSEARRSALPNGAMRYPIALSIADSIVVRVYTIAQWFPAGTTLSTRIFGGAPDRWEFVGRPVQSHPLLGRLLTSGGKTLAAYQKGYGFFN